MYCPHCGSENQAETRFCTRCGTDLGVVADALSGKLSGSSKIDQRMVRLLKNYYRGRRGMMIGGPTVVACIIFLTIIFAVGFHDTLLPFALFALIPLIYGIISLFIGIARWNSAGSELKAMGHVVSQPAAPRSELSDAPKMVDAYSTDAIATPASVTEHTTRQLDARVRAKPQEPR